MSFQPYVPPEQLMKDRSEYARKGISRGKSVVALEYADGLLFLAENPSSTLHKISEIYDRIAFAGVGKYSEFEDLRISGVRLADLRGYSYGREDVTAKTLANAYSQALSAIFTTQMKPYEVEILVGQVGERPEENELFHILFDGSVADEKGFVGMGGRSDELTGHLRDSYRAGESLEGAVRLAAKALSDTEDRPIDAPKLEAAVMDRTRGRRKFRRLDDSEVAEILSSSSVEGGKPPP
ncbi:MAG: proteasome subunit alpha [Actinobacteria bacterium]|nr:proteasome subunit alpha [Actinomycetota bacterium]